MTKDTTMKATTYLLPRWLALAFLGALAAGVSSAWAQPRYVNYQGSLADNTGAPLPTGEYSLTFSIHAHPTSTTSANRVWGPFVMDGGTATGHAAKVQVTDGRFNVILGPVDTGSRGIERAFEGDERYLEVQVGQERILPRQQFLSTPYALKARGIAGSIDGPLTISGAFTVNGTAKSVEGGNEYYMVPKGAIIMWSGPLNAIPTGWLLCNGANGTPNLLDKFVMGTTDSAQVKTTGGALTHTHKVDPPWTDTTRAGATIARGLLGDGQDLTVGHFHSVDIAEFDSKSASSLPPYIKLGFIMRQ